VTMPLAEDLRATLIVPVPEAEPLVGHWRLEHDPPAPFGIPAHITLLFPFRPAYWLGEQGVADLAAFFCTVQPGNFALTHIGRFTAGVLYLAPEPAEPFVELTKQLSERFDLLPYGRATSGRNPHLTVARHEDPSFLDRVADALTPSLPLEFTMREAWLMERDTTGYWHRTETFTLGSQG
jgi:2'-5' RNA ligase